MEKVTVGIGEKNKRKKLQGPEDDPALQKENRQAVKNQGQVTPEDYPDRTETPV